jgi:hypothetical protein
LDICSPSCGQKKGRESNWQFDSRPLKVGNRPVPDVRSESATWLESPLRRLQLWFRPRPDRRSGRGAMTSQSPGTLTGIVSGQLRDSISGVPGKSDIRMPLPWVNAEYTIGSKVVAYSRVRAVVSLVCPNARGKSQHPRVSRNVN